MYVHFRCIFHLNLTCHFAANHFSNQRLWDCHYARFQDIVCLSKLLVCHKRHIILINKNHSCSTVSTYRRNGTKSRNCEKQRLFLPLHVCVSTEERFKAITTSVSWKIHGLFYGENHFFFIIFIVRPTGESLFEFCFCYAQ